MPSLSILQATWLRQKSVISATALLILGFNTVTSAHRLLGEVLHRPCKGLFLSIHLCLFAAGLPWELLLLNSRNCTKIFSMLTVWESVSLSAYLPMLFCLYSETITLNCQRMYFKSQCYPVKIFSFIWLVVLQWFNISLSPREKLTIGCRQLVEMEYSMQQCNASVYMEAQNRGWCEDMLNYRT